MKAENYRSIVWRQFKKSRLAVAALAVVCFLFVVAIFAPIIASDKTISVGPIKISALIPFSPNSYDLSRILERPSRTHLLGTDGEGRDVLSQLVWGARISLSVGFVAVIIAVIIGVMLGAIAGYYGGIFDLLISRLIEVMMCFPTFFLIIAALAFIGPSIYNIMVVVGLTGWTGVARLMRAECLKLRSRGFVVAARVAGASHNRVMWRHLLPNAISPVLVSATFGISSAILVEASLSFLGFGAPPSSPSWGRLLSQAQDFMDVAWWLTLAPGFAIFITVTAYNLIGEGIRDAMDPNLKT